MELDPRFRSCRLMPVCPPWRFSNRDAVRQHQHLREAQCAGWFWLYEGRSRQVEQGSCLFCRCGLWTARDQVVSFGSTLEASVLEWLRVFFGRYVVEWRPYARCLGSVEGELKSLQSGLGQASAGESLHRVAQVRHPSKSRE